MFVYSILDEGIMPLGYLRREKYPGVGQVVLQYPLKVETLWSWDEIFMHANNEPTWSVLFSAAAGFILLLCSPLTSRPVNISHHIYMLRLKQWIFHLFVEFLLDNRTNCTPCWKIKNLSICLHTCTSITSSFYTGILKLFWIERGMYAK